MKGSESKIGDIVNRTALTAHSRQLIRRVKASDSPIYSNVMSKRTKSVLGLKRIAPLSKEWMVARGKLLTASRMAACLGENPYCSQRKLFLQMTNQSARFTGNDATRWGQKYEAEAAAVYSRVSGLELVEEEIGLIVSDYTKGDERKRYGATPDFMTKGGIMVEIKCPFRRKIQHEIPEYYMAQVQFQMIVTGTTMAHFVQYKPPSDFSDGMMDIYPVMRDPMWWVRAQPELDEFWDRVIGWYEVRGREVGQGCFVEEETDAPDTKVKSLWIQSDEDAIVERRVKHEA